LSNGYISILSTRSVIVVVCLIVIKSLKHDLAFASIVLHSMAAIGDTMPAYAMKQSYSSADKSGGIRSPDYRESDPVASRIPDLRNTLFWTLNMLCIHSCKKSRNFLYYY